MSQGYVIHAYNNMEIDYGTMALCSALLIKKNCKINATSLITTADTLQYMEKIHDRNIVNAAFDQIQVIDINRSVKERKYFDTRYTVKNQPYYNLNRSDTFTLSPFDETILLDADYLILDNSFDYVWNGVEDILVNKVVTDLRHRTNLSGFDLRFNDMSIPLYWATSVYFTKSKKSQTLFQLMTFIKENYDYYQALYNFLPNSYFRNDYALSIAIHMISGQYEIDSIKSFPNSQLLTATEYDDLINFKDNTAYFVSEENPGDFSLHKVRTNVHVMNKWSIGRNAERIISYATSK